MCTIYLVLLHKSRKFNLRKLQPRSKSSKHSRLFYIKAIPWKRKHNSNRNLQTYSYSSRYHPHGDWIRVRNLPKWLEILEEKRKGWVCLRRQCRKTWETHGK